MKQHAVWTQIETFDPETNEYASSEPVMLGPVFDDREKAEALQNKIIDKFIKEEKEPKVPETCFTCGATGTPDKPYLVGVRDTWYCSKCVWAAIKG